MPWNVITTGTVLEEFTAQETALLKNVQGGGDKLASVLARVIGRARGAVLAGGTPVGPDGTVPDSLADAVIDITRWRWLASFPVLKALQTEQRKDAHDLAGKLLSAVASGAQRVELPEIAKSDTARAPAPAFKKPRRFFTPWEQGGA